MKKTGCRRTTRTSSWVCLASGLKSSVERVEDANLHEGESLLSDRGGVAAEDPLHYDQSPSRDPVVLHSRIQRDAPLFRCAARGRASRRLYRHHDQGHADLSQQRQHAQPLRAHSLPQNAPLQHPRSRLRHRTRRQSILFPLVLLLLIRRLLSTLDRPFRALASPQRNRSDETPRDVQRLPVRAGRSGSAAQRYEPGGDQGDGAAVPSLGSAARAPEAHFHAGAAESADDPLVFPALERARAPVLRLSADLLAAAVLRGRSKEPNRRLRVPQGLREA